MNKYKKEIAEITNTKRQKGTLDDIIKNADVFIGVSGIKGLLLPKMIQSMSKDPIIFALTNPDPEIDPKIATKSGARIIATGSYMYENKINNALVFPYLMRVILDRRIRKISLDLLYATAKAVANTVPTTQLAYNHIMPEIGNKQIQNNISRALKKFK
jgi:malate dehydrogenase (oxaloacetate-decarboxylating)